MYLLFVFTGKPNHINTIDTDALTHGDITNILSLDTHRNFPECAPLSITRETQGRALI